MHQPTATTAFLFLHKQSQDSVNPPHQGQNRDAEPVSTKTAPQQHQTGTELSLVSDATSKTFKVSSHMRTGK